jgi:hypothetical protein
MVQVFLSLAGVLSLGFAGWIGQHIASDIQIGIVATCLVGGVLMIGQASILHELAAIRRKQGERDAA